MEYQRIRIISLLLFVLLDFVNLQLFRELLFQMLVGNTNRKHARKIQKEQSLWNRVSMEYVKLHLTRFQKDFRIYQTAYLIYLFSVIPSLLVTSLCLFMFAKIIEIPIIVIGLIKILFFIVLRFSFGLDGHISKYLYTNNQLSKNSRKKHR